MIRHFSRVFVAVGRPFWESKLRTRETGATWIGVWKIYVVRAKSTFSLCISFWLYFRSSWYHSFDIYQVHSYSFPKWLSQTVPHIRSGYSQDRIIRRIVAITLQCGLKRLVKVTQLISLIMTLFLKLNKRLRSRPNVTLFTRRTKLSELCSRKLRRLAHLSSSKWVWIVKYALPVSFRRIERLKIAGLRDKRRSSHATDKAKKLKLCMII